jgi:hypothetical protein
MIEQLLDLHGKVAVILTLFAVPTVYVLFAWTTKSPQH